MTEFEAPEADALEQDEPVAGDAASVDLEAPDADAAEQQALASPRERPDATLLPDDVDEADAADQFRVVELDEDDYR